MVHKTNPDRFDKILKGSVSAQKKWQQLRVKERADILKRVQKQLVKKSEELIFLISEETGKPFWDSFIEVMTAVEHLKYMCSHAPLILSQEKRSPGIFLHKKAYVRYFPHGTAGIISPWNYPLILTASPVVEALLSGNTVVLKPSELTPLTGNKIRQIFLEGGIPKDVFQVVHGFGDTGAAMVESPMTDIICFTGSVKVGRVIAETCGKKLKPSILELGGSDPMIVLEDANLDRAISAAIWGGFSNCGQTCISVERIYVLDSIADLFIEGIKKQALNLTLSDNLENADLGGMINQNQKQAVKSFLDEAREEGITFHLDDKEIMEDKSCFLPPTIIESDKSPSSLMQSEIFGPVITVTRVYSEKEAINKANSSEFGLSASVFSKNLRRARRVASQIKAGSVCINDINSNYLCASLPFGGVGVSGIGRVHGPEGLKAFSHVQAVCEDRLGFKKELWWFPISDVTKKWFKRFFKYWYR